VRDDVMAYQITAVSGSVEERREVAAFLAAFVRDGELLLPRPGDDDPAVWQRRMGWWWDDNPHCHDDSPRGFLLRHDEAGLVGFSGLIPFTYEAAGESIPTLVTTTFFVRERHRSAVMGLISRQRELGRTHQIIDGSPSPEMRRILGKLGYLCAGDRAQYLFPTGRLGGAAARLALAVVGWSVALPSKEEVEKCCFVSDPGEWSDPNQHRNDVIRRVSDPATLAWLARSGSEPRSFFGLLDADGMPLARALGVYKQRAGVKACLLLDYADFHPGGAGLLMLVKKLLDDPGARLDPATALIVLSRFGGITYHGMPGHCAESILHHHLPELWRHHPRVCLPVEGDLVLL
jgi:hypothetical protein